MPFTKSSLATRLILGSSLLLTLFVIGTVAVVRQELREETRWDAEQLARTILARNMAMHTYFSNELKPAIFNDLIQNLPPDYFNPTWMSSTYAIREIDRIYQQETRRNFRYKEVAINSRSPENEATSFERSLLQEMQADPSLQEFSRIEYREKKPYFAFYMRGETMEESCVTRCHGVPEHAPAGMVDLYGSTRSFHRTAGELVSLISIQIPLDHHFVHANILALKVSVILLTATILLAILLWVMVRRQVISPVLTLRERVLETASHPDRPAEPVRIEGAAEIADLVDGHNRMTSRLVSYHTELEQRISERTRELAESEQLVVSLLHLLPSGLLLIDSKDQVRLANPACRTILDTRNETDALDLLRQFEILTTLRERSQTTQVSSYKGLEIVTLSGRLKNIDLFAARLQHQGEPMLLVVLADQTEITQARDRLAETLKSRYDFFVTSPHPVFILDAEDTPGIILDANPCALELHGYTREELIGRHIAVLTKNGDESFINRRILQFQPGKHYSMQDQHVTKDGRTIDLLIVSSATRLDQKLRIISIETDISARVQHEEEMRAAMQLVEDANRSKTVFLANMSHEIRTPLNGILGMLELLSLSELSSENREYVSLSMRAGKTLLTLINEILDLARVESGRIDLHPSPFRPSEVLNFVGDFFAEMARGKQISLIIDHGIEIPQELIGDEQRIRQILLNIAGNAVKFTETGSVMLGQEWDSQSQELVLSVTDTGPGIPDSMRERLFEPFTQADSSYRKQYQGSGLGLSIVKRFTDLMGGNILIESTPGKGTRVRVRLPLEAMTSGSDTNRLITCGRKSPSQRPFNILVAEDNPTNEIVIRKLLQKRGHRVTSVTNGEEVLKALKQSVFDLILMDVQMPLLDGVETTQIIRDDCSTPYHRIPIIALTAYAMDGDQESFVGSGMDGYLAKPVDIRALDRILSELQPA